LEPPAKPTELVSNPENTALKLFLKAQRHLSNPALHKMFGGQGQRRTTSPQPCAFETLWGSAWQRALGASLTGHRHGAAGQVRGITDLWPFRLYLSCANSDCHPTPPTSQWQHMLYHLLLKQRPKYPENNGWLSSTSFLSSSSLPHP